LKLFHRLLCVFVSWPIIDRQSSYVFASVFRLSRSKDKSVKLLSLIAETRSHTDIYSRLWGSTCNRIFEKLTGQLPIDKLAFLSKSYLANELILRSGPENICSKLSNRQEKNSRQNFPARNRQFEPTNKSIFI
jgi:hypothetical protein